MPAMYVFRVRGLPKNTTPEALKQLLVEQADEQVTLEVTDVCPAPGGLPGAEETCTAIFGVEGKIPAFLQPLMKDSVPAVTFKHYGHTVEVDKNFYGFTQLYPNSGDFIKADVIALSGINSHAYGSWAGKGEPACMWLRDFFRNDFPDCRVMTYGYDSRLQSNGVHTMLQYKKEFLAELKNARQGALNERPVIFIGHSYGGLVVAQSLVEASKQTDDPFFAGLVKATKAIMFFGTPHRGMAIENLLDAMEATGAIEERKELVKAIDHNCTSLQDELKDFIKLAPGIKICTFTETYQTAQVIVDQGQWRRDVKGMPATAVTKASSILSLPPDVEERFPADGDHSTLVKLGSPHNDTYTTVVCVLDELLEELESKAA